MKSIPRHQCLIYSGAPSDHLLGLAATINEKRKANYRCLYLNSPPMVAGIRSYLAASGLDVIDEIEKGRLVLSSDRGHLICGVFEPETMLGLLKDTFDAALNDGYVGLWASGDMAWQFGPAKDFGKLVEYERALEAFFQTHPTMCGVCQYHSDVLPREVMNESLVLHPALYVNQTLSRLNAHYVPSPLLS